MKNSLKNVSLMVFVATLFVGCGTSSTNVSVPNLNEKKGIANIEINNDNKVNPCNTKEMELVIKQQEKEKYKKMFSNSVNESREELLLKLNSLKNTTILLKDNLVYIDSHISKYSGEIETLATTLKTLDFLPIPVIDDVSSFPKESIYFLSNIANVTKSNTEFYNSIMLRLNELNNKDMSIEEYKKVIISLEKETLIFAKKEQENVNKILKKITPIIKSIQTTKDYAEKIGNKIGIDKLKEKIANNGSINNLLDKLKKLEDHMNNINNGNLDLNMATLSLKKDVYSFDKFNGLN
jgi:hypothetical protein